MYRREFLKASATSAPLAVWGGSDSSGREDGLGRTEGGYPKRPDHITDVRDDEEELLEFQPKLYYGHLPWSEQQQAKSDMRGMFGWTAESEEHDVTAHYYWVRSNTQRSILYYLGVDWGPDDHFTDHEPIIVFRDSDKTVQEVWCSGGHHYGLQIEGDQGIFTEDRVDGKETHVNLAVARPHNHFMETALNVEGEFVQDFAEFGSWIDQRQSWYDNNRYESTSYEAVEDPFAFYAGEREHWWREDTRDAWFARNVWIPLGLSEGTSRDELEYED